MPVGPYKDFATCVAAQRKKGHSEERAKRISGEIEKRSQSSLDPAVLEENCEK